MTERGKLLAAWQREWAAAISLGLTPESLPYFAPNEEILRRGKALRKMVTETREAWGEAQRFDAVQLARLAGIQKEHAAGILAGIYPLTETLIEDLSRQLPGREFRINVAAKVLEAREKSNGA